MSTETTEDRYRRFVEACARAAGRGAALWGEPLEPLVLERIEAHGVSPARILVAGCGTGRGLAELLGQGHDCWAFDACAAMVDLTREAVGLGAARCVAGRADALPGLLGGRRFDLVLALGLVSGGIWLEVAGPRPGLAGLVAALAPGGRLLLDFLDGGSKEPGRLACFDYPLADGGRVPGCCYCPSRAQVQRELAALGLQARMRRLRHNPQEPLWLAEGRLRGGHV